MDRVIAVVFLQFMLVSASATDSIPDSASVLTPSPESVGPQTSEYTIDSTAAKNRQDSLVALSHKQWIELSGYLSESGLNSDSSSTVGAAYDPLEKKFVLILVNADGRVDKKPLNTPSWLYEKIVQTGTFETATESKAVVTDSSPEKGIKRPIVTPGRQDGRTYFIINTTVRATGIYPSALALAMPDVDVRIIAGVAMLTFGGALYGSYALTGNMDLGYGKVAMMNFGGELGVYYPILLSMMLSEQGSEKTVQNVLSWGMIFGFPVGITAASFTRFVDNHEYGNAALMRHFGRVGLIYGFTIPLLWSFNNSFRNYMTVSSALSMFLIPAGFSIGKIIVGDRSFSAGRSGMVVIGGIMGAITGLVIPSWAESETPELYVSMGLAGSIGGTLLGFLYHKEKEYKLWQGVFIGVSAAIGAGMGMSLPFIARADDHRPYTILGVGGAWTGMFLGEHLSKTLFETSSRDRPTTSLNIEFPVAWEWPTLVCAALSANGHGRRTGSPTGHASLLRLWF